MKVDERIMNECLADMFEHGGKPNMLVMSEGFVRWYRRYVLSGVIATEAKKARARQTKAARRRNRGRGAFARFR